MRQLPTNSLTSKVSGTAVTVMTEITSVAGRVIDTLVEIGSITSDQVAAVRETAPDSGEAGRQLLARGLITAPQLAAVLEDEMGFPRVDLTSYAPDDEAIALVPAEVARRFNVLPLFEIEGTLTVAIGEAADIFDLDSAGGELGFAMDAVLADASAVRDAVTHHYGEQIVAPELPVTPTPEPVQEEPTDFVAAMEAESEPAIAEEAENVAQTVEEVVQAEATSGPATLDLDVLAVADERRVAVLVSDILEQAVSRGLPGFTCCPTRATSSSSSGSRAVSRRSRARRSRCNSSSLRGSRRTRSLAGWRPTGLRSGVCTPRSTESSSC